MPRQTDRVAGVTYVGARAFAVAFCAVCGVFLAIFFGVGRLTDPLEAGAPDTPSGLSEAGTAGTNSPLTVAAVSAAPAPANVAATPVQSRVAPAMPVGAATAAPLVLRHAFGAETIPLLPRRLTLLLPSAVHGSPASGAHQPSLAKSAAPSRNPGAPGFQVFVQAAARPTAVKRQALPASVRVTALSAAVKTPALPTSVNVTARPTAVKATLSEPKAPVRGIKVDATPLADRAAVLVEPQTSAIAPIHKTPTKTATAATPVRSPAEKPAGAGQAFKQLLVPFKTTATALGTGQLTPCANPRDSLVVAAPPSSISQSASTAAPRP